MTRDDITRRREEGLARIRQEVTERLEAGLPPIPAPTDMVPKAPPGSLGAIASSMGAEDVFSAKGRDAYLGLLRGAGWGEWHEHDRACEMRAAHDQEGMRFVPLRFMIIPKMEAGDLSRFSIPIRRITSKMVWLPLLLLLLGGCQGWLHGAELGFHGPDPRIERNHRASQRAVMDILEADYAAVEQANVVDPKTGRVTRENLEKQFRLLRFKALQIEVIDRMLREAAAYNGVDLGGKAGASRSEAGERAAKLRRYIEDIAKEQGKDLAEEVLDGLRGD